MSKSSEKVTYFGVQSFTQNGEGEFRALPMRNCKTETEAKMLAGSLGARGGAVAFSRTGDPEMGDYEDPVILSIVGLIPDEVREELGGPASFNDNSEGYSLYPPATVVPRQLSWDAAERTAIAVLNWLVADEARISAFFAASGIQVSNLRAAAARPAFLRGVMEHVLADEPLAKTIAETLMLQKDALMAAGRTLGAV